MKNHFLLLFLLSCISGSLARHSNWEALISTSGMYAFNDDNPFWFTANNNAQFGDQTSFSLPGEVTGSYSLSETTTWTAGAAFHYRDEADTTFQRRDLNLEYKNLWLCVIPGAKRDGLRAQGLSSTNKYFLRSGNTSQRGFGLTYHYFI